jgi:hypothetical protein
MWLFEPEYERVPVMAQTADPLTSHQSNPTQYKSPIDGSVQNNPMNVSFTGETDDEAVNALDRVLSLVNRAFDRSFDESTLVR